jgi:adenylylsulfate kinase-like enzyme
VKQRYSLTRGHVLWFTGLPAAGKTTLAQLLKRHLDGLEINSIALDGDDLREVFSDIVGNDLDARSKRSLAYARLTSGLVRNPVVVLAASITATKAQRAAGRSLHDPTQFSLVWVKTPRETCIARDPKGLYRWAFDTIAQGQQAQVVGVDMAFEDPVDAELTFDTVVESSEACCKKTVEYLLQIGVLRADHGTSHRE